MCSKLQFQSLLFCLQRFTCICQWHWHKIINKYIQVYYIAISHYRDIQVFFFLKRFKQKYHIDLQESIHKVIGGVFNHSRHARFLFLFSSSSPSSTSNHHHHRKLTFFGMHTPPHRIAPHSKLIRKYT